MTTHGQKEKFARTGYGDLTDSRWRRPYVGFGQAMKLWWRYKFTMRGRATRSEFWWVALFSWLTTAVMSVAETFAHLSVTPQLTVFEALTTGIFDGHGDPLNVIISAIVRGIQLLLWLFSIALTVRRLHDIGWSGVVYPVLLVLGIIPIIGLFAGAVFLIAMIMPSRKEGLRYEPAFTASEETSYDRMTPHSPDR